MMKYLFVCMVLITGIITNGYSEEWINYGNHNWITCSTQENSYLWVGTNNGLVKLNTSNGQKTYYDKTNSGLSDMNVISVMVDGQGKKWIGTENGGLCRLNGTIWTVWNTNNSGIPSNHVTGIASDAYNNIWITTDKGLGRLSNGTWINWNTTNSGLPDNYLSCIAIDNSGTKWIGSGEGVVSFSGNAWNHLTTDDGVSAISIDNQGHKWFGFHSNGLAKLNGSTWTYYNPDNSGIPDVTVDCMATDSAGNVWLCTEEGESTIRGGLTKFDGTNWTTWNTANSSLPLDIIASITIMNGTNVWAGVLLKGMTTFDGTTWNTFDLARSGISDPYINCIEIDNLGRKWIGSEYGLSMYVGSYWTTWGFLHNDGQVLIDVASIAVDNDNIVWVNSDNGDARQLYSYDGTAWTQHQPLEFGLSALNVNCIKTDNQNNKWIGTGQSLIRFNGTSHTIFNSTNSPINGRISDVERDAYGNIWVASDVGLLQYNGSTWTSKTTTNSNIPSNQIHDIAIDSFGDKWLATSNGLCRYNDLSFSIWNVANSNIPSNNVYSVEIDLNNQVWVVTNKCDQWGYPSDGVLSCLSENIWTNWTASNSALPNNYINDLTIDSFGNKWIASYGGGLSEFNLDEIAVGSGLPPARVEGLVVSVLGNDAHLAWQPVTTTINGTPIEPDGYIVLYNETPNVDEHFYYFHSFVTGTSCVHSFVAQNRQRMFYRIVAVKSYQEAEITYLMSLNESRDRLTWGDVKDKLHTLKQRQ